VVIVGLHEPGLPIQRSIQWTLCKQQWITTMTCL